MNRSAAARAGKRMEHRVLCRANGAPQVGLRRPSAIESRQPTGCVNQVVRIQVSKLPNPRLCSGARRKRTQRNVANRASLGVTGQKRKFPLSARLFLFSTCQLLGTFSPSRRLGARTPGAGRTRASRSAWMHHERSAEFGWMPRGGSCLCHWPLPCCFRLIRLASCSPANTGQFTLHWNRYRPGRCQAEARS